MTCVGWPVRATWGTIRAYGPCEVRSKSPSDDVAITCLRVFTLFWPRACMKPCLPYQFCQVHIQAQYKTVWMLYGLGNTRTIGRTWPYGAFNGPIAPNRPAGPLTDPYGIRMTIQGLSTGQNRTMTVSKSCTCPTFSHGLQNYSQTCAGRHGKSCDYQWVLRVRPLRYFNSKISIRN